MMVYLTTGISLRVIRLALRLGDLNIVSIIFRVLKVNRYAFDIELLTIDSLLKLHAKEIPRKMK
jgi:hypothetical protein